MQNCKTSAGTAAEKRSKCSLFSRLPLLLAILLLCAVSGKAQTKIGDITIADSIAQKYFADCYLRPDTIPLKTMRDFNGNCNGCYVNVEEENKFKRYMDEYNENLLRISIGRVTDTVRYSSGVDTIYNWYSNTTHSKTFTLYKHDAGYYVNYGVYLVPRKPNEQDFIRWRWKALSK